MGLLRRLALGAFLACLATFPVAIVYGVVVRPPSLAVGWAFVGVAATFLAVGAIFLVIDYLRRRHRPPS